MAGHIEDCGRLNDWMKFAGDGGKLNPLDLPGVEKSSIWSFSMMPVRLDLILLPKLKKYIIFVD